MSSSLEDHSPVPKGHPILTQTNLTTFDDTNKTKIQLTWKNVNVKTRARNKLCWKSKNTGSEERIILGKYQPLPNQT